MQQVGSGGTIALPVVAGLSIGIAFLAIFSYSEANFLPMVRTWDRPPELNEFVVPDQLAEVKLLKAKYSPESVLEGFGRYANRTIQFSYLVAASIDADGDGLKETVRQLELTATYDETAGLMENNPHARLLEMQVHCREPSGLDMVGKDVVAPAENGKVLEFIKHVQCIY